MQERLSRKKLSAVAGIFFIIGLFAGIVLIMVVINALAIAFKRRLYSVF